MSKPYPAKFIDQLVDYVNSGHADLTIKYATGEWPTYCALERGDVDQIKILHAEYLRKLRRIISRSSAYVTNEWIDQHSVHVDIDPILRQFAK